MDFLGIAAGFVLLFLGGEALVRGSVALARRFGISPLVIGLTIVGFGTSTPELVVSLNAALAGSPGISVGNVVGSNMANMMLILGVAAVISPMAARPDAVRRDGLAMVAATVIFVAIGLKGSVGLGFGAVMVALLAAYIGGSLWRDVRSGDGAAELHREEAEELTGLPIGVPAMVAWIAFGILMLVGGSDLLVDGAVSLARKGGVSEEVIGLTLVAVGTSLPELATSIVAAYRGHAEVCIGNVLGSNIFNLFGILGVTALFVEVPFGAKIAQFDLWALLVVTVVLVPLLLTGRRLDRLEGGGLLAGYGVYVAAQFFGFGGVAAAG